MAVRFFVFGGDHYYPSGGVEDLIGSADTMEAACKIVEKFRDKKRKEKYHDAWWHIADAETLKMVKFGIVVHGGE